MARIWLVAVSLTGFLLGAAVAQGQQASEQFIPIGRSPGLSKAYTDISVLAAVDPEVRSVTLSLDGGRKVKVPVGTSIWLDRSKTRQPNVVGGFEDLRVGRQVEVKYRDESRRDTAEWIKIAPAPVD